MEAQAEAWMVALEIMGDCGQAPPMQTSKSDTDLPPLSSDAKTLSMPAPGGNMKPYQFSGERIRCSSDLFVVLRERVLSKRSERKSWNRKLGSMQCNASGLRRRGVPARMADLVAKV